VLGHAIGWRSRTRARSFFLLPRALRCERQHDEGDDARQAE